MTRSPLLVLLVFSALFWSPLARAHDPFVAEIKAEADASTLTVRVTFARSVAAYLAGVNEAPRLAYPAERFAADDTAFFTAAASLTSLTFDAGAHARLLRATAALADEDQDIVLTVAYARPATATHLRLSCPWLTRLPAAENYVATFVLHENGALLAGPLLVSADDPTVAFDLPAAPVATTPSAAPSTPSAGPAAPPADAPRVHAGGFFKLGVEHILTGYDHLLYLAALILGCTGLRAIVGIVTAFTISHSLTLALATLGWVNPPSALVEQIIAASIVFVALENLWLRGRAPKFRHLIAFAFGLIHGFGFAGLLADLGVGAENGAVVVPLLSFNLGVEAGQLLVILVTLPLLLRARRHPRFVAYAQPAASLAVAALGLIWLIDRL
jgi:hypothetical protein